MRFLFLSLSSLSLLACVGTGNGDTAAFDTALSTSTSTSADTDATTNSTPVDSADSGTTTPDTATTDSGETEDTSPPPPPPVFWELPDPCQGQATPKTILFDDEMNGWVGCGNGIGLWQTIDGGDSFTEGHFATRTKELYVNQLLRDPDGNLLLCGHDYIYDKTLIYRYDGSNWTELLHYGSNTYDPTSVQFSNCGVLAAGTDGTLLAASETAGDITTSTDNGLTWTKEERYWEDANLSGGYAYYYLLNLTYANGHYYGAGSDITDPPVFLGPSTDPNGAWYNFHATVIDPHAIGEVWSLATNDNGTTWFAGGRDQRITSAASGFFYISEDGGNTWAQIALGGDLDIMHDIRFADDGLHGIAVGHRYPPTTHGGYILLTEDGGQTWTERTESVPPLYVAGIVGTTWWVGGDGFFARGIF